MKRAAIFTLFALLATAVAGLGVAAYAQEPPPPGVVVEQVEICHKPPSSGRQTVSVESIVKDQGHDNDPTDIIPPFTYDGGTYPGKNWDLEGQATWYYGCDPADIPDVRPTLQCVENTATGLLAHFGYANGEGRDVDIAVGLVNRFDPPPENRGQPATFKAGTHPDVLTVPFSGSLSWILAGTAVTASSSSTRCQASIQIDKALDPANDPGLFDLLLDGVALATDVGNRGTTGPHAVNTGQHTVGERAGRGTDLADYETTIICRDDGGVGRAVVQADGPSLTVTVANGQQLVCVILNRRGAEPGPGQVDLQVVKSVKPRVVQVGRRVTWTVTVTNKGPETATNVVLVDSLPDDVSLVDGSVVVPPNVTCVGSRCTIPSLAPGASVTGRFTTTTLAVGRKTNVVTVSADQEDVNPADNAASATVYVIDLARAVLTPILECVDVLPGGYRAHFGYRNRGSRTVPVGIGPRNAFTPAPEDRGQPRRFQPGRKIDVFQVDFQGTLDWTLVGKHATASGSSPRCGVPQGTLRIDKILRPEDDPGRFDLEIDGTPAGTGRGVGHLGTTGDIAVAAGQHTVGEEGADGTSLANYDISIVCHGNRGQGPVTSQGTGAELVVDVPQGGEIVCTIVNERRNGPPTPQPEPEPGPTPPPTPEPGTSDLEIRKFVDRRVALLGDLVTWTLVVTNHGPLVATGVTITDEAAARATIVSLRVAQGTCGTTTCSLGAIPVGGSVRVTAQTRMLTVGARLNTAVVRGDGPDSIPENNVASALIRVLSGFSPPLAERCGDLSVDRRTARAQVLVSVNAVVRNVFGRPLAGTMVSARGAGQATRARTNADGVARFRLAATRAGVVRVTVGARTLSAAGARRCAARVGVRGFGGVLPAESPPFTG